MPIRMHLQARDCYKKCIALNPAHPYANNNLNDLESRVAEITTAFRLPSFADLRKAVSFVDAAAISNSVVRSVMSIHDLSALTVTTPSFTSGKSNTIGKPEKPRFFYGEDDSDSEDNASTADLRRLDTEVQTPQINVAAPPIANARLKNADQASAAAAPSTKPAAPKGKSLFGTMEIATMAVNVACLWVFGQ